MRTGRWADVAESNSQLEVAVPDATTSEVQLYEQEWHSEAQEGAVLVNPGSSFAEVTSSSSTATDRAAFRAGQGGVFLRVERRTNSGPSRSPSSASPTGIRTTWSPSLALHRVQLSKFVVQRSYTRDDAE